MNQYESETHLAQAMFGHAELGDHRRTRRLVETFRQMICHPDGTLPHKMAGPADLKALYRLCDSEAVSHEALVDAMREYTMRRIERHNGTVLVVHDATELDYTTLQSLADQLGQIGNGHHRGYVCQNVIAVDPQTGELLGLLDQVLHRRDRVARTETLTQSRNRESRESLLWLKGTQSLPDSGKLVDVCDRGADTFEFFEHEFQSGRRFVVRNGKPRKVRAGHDKTVHDESEEIHYLKDYVQGLGELGRFTRDVPKQKGRKARKDAEFAVRGGPILLLPPHAKHGNHGNDPLPIYAVYVSEVSDPPEGETAIDWVLLTNEPVHTYDDARRVIEWYEHRWVIEEYHKAMKTGCRIETLQFTAVDRLQPAIALLSGVALTLLNLRDASRRSDAHDRRAQELIAPDYVEVLSLWRYQQCRSDLTVHDFYYALARLGGHQNRKHDSRPGWLVLWRGWHKLQSMCDGYRIARQNIP